MTSRSRAASITLRVIGPAVSCVSPTGTIPRREISAIVAFRPTRPLTVEGPVTEPLVSVPMVAAAKLTEEATPEPELDPEAVRVVSYALWTAPPTVEPLNAVLDRQLAHCERLALPGITMPAERNLCDTSESRLGMFFSNA